MALTNSENETFTAFLYEKANEAQKALNYRPSYFLQMLSSVGGYEAVVTLISQPSPSDGFTKLWERGRLDLSVEALVVESKWREHFDQIIIAAAENRLRSVHYQPKVISSISKHLSIDAASDQFGFLPFRLANQYSRSDIFYELKISPEPVGGAWFTGYVEYDGNCFIFCNVGVPGRTGHDYENRFEADRLIWFGKGPSKLRHGSIQRLLKPSKHLYIFYRFNDRDLFTFAGIGRPHQVFDTTPVKVIWDFSFLSAPDDEQPPSLILTDGVIEGASKTINAKIYERDRGARLKCIGHWGWQCHVCTFDFVAIYGDLGKGFIHVHHLKPLGEIGEAHILDPVADLRPVCPNCHAMLHRCTPALSIEVLKSYLLQVGSN